MEWIVCMVVNLIEIFAASPFTMIVMAPSCTSRQMSGSQKFSWDWGHNINFLLGETNVWGQNKLLLKRAQNHFQNFFSELALILFLKNSIINQYALNLSAQWKLLCSGEKLWKKKKRETEEEVEVEILISFLKR